MGPTYLNNNPIFPESQSFFVENKQFKKSVRKLKCTLLTQFVICFVHFVNWFTAISPTALLLAPAAGRESVLVKKLPKEPFLVRQTGLIIRKNIEKRFYGGVLRRHRDKKGMERHDDGSLRPLDSLKWVPKFLGFSAVRNQYPLGEKFM